MQTKMFRPQLSALLPNEWLAKESITLLAPSGRANVIASSEPLSPDIDTREYAEVQGSLLRREFPGYREIASEWTEVLGGRQGYIRRFEWLPERGEPVTQTQIYYAENGRGYTATATATSAEIDDYVNELSLILGSITIMDNGQEVNPSG